MMFVDGENLTIRAREVFLDEIPDERRDLLRPRHYERDSYFWPTFFGNELLFSDIAGWGGSLQTRAHRAHYYTQIQGDSAAYGMAREHLRAKGFEPVVFQKVRAKKSKGVDITLTKDMLVHANAGHYDVAVLVAGDGDYVPLVQEVKRQGCLVYVAFFAGEGDRAGLNPALRLEADSFVDLTATFKDATETMIEYEFQSAREQARPGVSK